MSHLAYAGILAFVLVGCLWLEIVLRTRVLVRLRRLLLSLAPVVVAFAAWDAYAISHGHWWFDPDRILGIDVAFRVPIDEIGFFIVVPLAAILSFEAVRSVRGWPVGDEGDES